MRKLLVILILLPAIISCKKHKGYDRVKDAEIVSDQILTCLGSHREGEYVIREVAELKDTAIFHNNIQANVVASCWAKLDAPDIDFSDRSLIGIGFTYWVESTIKNGTASVKIWHNSSKDDYIIDMTVNSAEQGGISAALDQIWFAVPKMSATATVKVNKILI